MALEETRKVLPTLKEKIVQTVANLGALIVSGTSLFYYLSVSLNSINQFRQIEEGKKGSESNVEHITAAKEAIAQAKIAQREIS